jgi:prenyltransferase beta subunit
MKDKPSKHPDIYHTCYSLSGLSVSQTKSAYEELHSSDLKHLEFTGLNQDQENAVLLGAVASNQLPRMNPIYNGRFDKVAKAKAYFRSKKI